MREIVEGSDILKNILMALNIKSHNFLKNVENLYS